MDELDVLIVGGGISGLATAHRLAGAGLSVEVWEAADHVGGKIRTARKDGYCLENAASMVVNFRSEIDPFLRSAGLEAEKQPCAPGGKRYVVHADQLHEVPTRFADLVRTPLLSRAGKLRLLAEPLVPRGGRPDESVARFVSRRLGREFLDKFFEPYVAGPLASDVDLAEARATTPRLVALEQRFSSIAVGAVLGRIRSRGGSAARPQMFSFTGGMQTLVDALAREGGFCVRTGHRVCELRPASGGWMARSTIAGASRNVLCRRIVLSVPAEAAAGLVHELDPELAALLRDIEYAPIRVVHTGFEQSAVGHALDGSGFLVPRGSRFAANGCLWISSLFPAHAPQGRVLLSTYLGGARNPGAAVSNDMNSVDAVMHMLRQILGVKAMPDLVHIETHTRGLPLYHGAYSQRLAAIDGRLAAWPGLHLEANYKGGVSVRDRILCADSCARRILRQHVDSQPCPRVAVRRAGRAGRWAIAAAATR